jgi:thioredoxin reductase
MAEAKQYDVLIVGGGPAGLSAAMVLGRAHRSVALVDAGTQSNRNSFQVHAVFTRDGMPPEELYAVAHEQLASYPAVQSINGVVSDIAPGPPFVATLESGEHITATFVLLAQGVIYGFPPIPGVAELWGREVWHCPYCHGFEATDKRLLAVGDEQWIKGMTALLPIWTEHITWAAVEEVQEIQRATSGGIVAMLSDGPQHFAQAIVQTTVIKRDELADTLGCRRNDKGQVEIADDNRTSVAGVYAAGDQSTEANQVNIAAGSGHRAAVAINEALGVTGRPSAVEPAAPADLK